MNLKTITAPARVVIAEIVVPVTDIDAIAQVGTNSSKCVLISIMVMH